MSFRSPISDLRLLLQGDEPILALAPMQDVTDLRFMRLMSDAVFCVQRNLAAAFYVNRPALQQCIPDLNRKRLRMVVRHPLGKLTYAFDKKNSDKIKGWLAGSLSQAS